MQKADHMTDGNATAFSDDILSHGVTCIEAIEARYEMAAIRPYLDACKAILYQKDAIDVGIFGRFKAGKSSLLNYLAGASVLPVGVTPVTAVVTRLRFGPAERAVVRYSSGRSEDVPVDLVKSFVSESGNPENCKRIASVTIELPSLKRYDGLQFVDTPGLDSVFQHNTDTALGWLPRVGLALVAISVDPPLSRHDVALIRTLRSYTPRIAIVITKADLLSHGETNEIASFIRERLRKEFDAEFRIFPFSTNPDYAGLRSSFVSNILQPLLENRDSTRADIVRFKFRALLSQAREYVGLALAAAQRADEDRSKLKHLILNEKTSFESIRMDLSALATECASQTRPWIMKRMDELRPAIVERVTQELSNRLSKMAANLWDLSRAFEQWLREVVACEMREVSQREGDHFCVPLEKARNTLSRAEQGFRDRLADNIQQALGIRFAPGQFESEIRKPSAPRIAIGNLFVFNTDLLWFIIPMAIFRPWAVKHFLGRIPYEIEKNLSRLASQWTDRINAAILRMQREAEKSVRDQIATVESLLSRTQSEAEGIRSALEEIDSLSSVLDSYKDNLDRPNQGGFLTETANLDEEKS
jgi:GTP-binding protein EngB required for normal cell division